MRWHHTLQLSLSFSLSLSLSLCSQLGILQRILFAEAGFSQSGFCSKPERISSGDSRGDSPSKRMRPPGCQAAQRSNHIRVHFMIKIIFFWGGEKFLFFKMEKCGLKFDSIYGRHLRNFAKSNLQKNVRLSPSVRAATNPRKLLLCRALDRPKQPAC